MVDGRAELDAAVVRGWAALGAAGLAAARTDIDAINVFPVADGDTGSNLAATWRAAARAVGSDGDGGAQASAVDLLGRMADAALDAARGSSGAILSQFLRGFADAGPDLRIALPAAAAAAHDAVADPVAGTVLTVAEEAGAAAARATGDAPTVAAAAAAAARAAVQRTTGQLGALAAAGVVDAGGRGLSVVLDALAAALGADVPVPSELAAGPAFEACGAAARSRFEVQFHLDTADAAVTGLRERLAAVGDAVVVAGGIGRYHVHVHTGDIGAVLDVALEAGRPSRVEVSVLPDDSGPATVSTVVAVAPAGILAGVMQAAGALVVSADDGSFAEALRTAVGSAAGTAVFLLPNSRELRPIVDEIAGAARAAGRDVAVIPTRSPVQGLAALAVHDPASRRDDAAVAMSAAAAATRYAAVEVADSDALTTAGPCRAGDVLGLIDDDVAVIGADLRSVAFGLLDRLLIGGGELVTVVPGTADARAIAMTLTDYLAATRPVVETTVYDDGAPGVPLLLGVE